MKLLLIILAIYTSVYGNYISPCSNHYNSYSSVPVEQTYRGIGYTTNYSNGQFNSGVYKSSMTTLEYQNRAFTGTYTPAASSSGESKPRGPRRVRVYDEKGNPEDTPGGDSDSADWDYMLDESGRWWCSRDGGKTWSFWSDGFTFIVSWISPGWYNSVWWGPDNPSGQTTEYYGYNPTPIGDATVPLLSLLLLYMFYDLFIRHRLKK